MNINCYKRGTGTIPLGKCQPSFWVFYYADKFPRLSGEHKIIVNAIFILGISPPIFVLQS